MTALAPQAVPGRMLESMVRLGPVICWLEPRGLPARAAVRVWQVTLRVSKGLLVWSRALRARRASLQRAGMTVPLQACPPAGPGMQAMTKVLGLVPMERREYRWHCHRRLVALPGPIPGWLGVSRLLRAPGLACAGWWQPRRQRSGRQQQEGSIPMARSADPGRPLHEPYPGARLASMREQL